MMQGSAFGPIQRAMYAMMTADAQLMTLTSNQVYDDVPQNTNFPYVDFGSMSSTAYRTHTRGGEEAVATLNVWSIYEGNKEIEAIFQRLNALFGDKAFAVEGYDNIMSYYDFSDILLQRDKIRHGVIRYRLLVQEQQN